MNFLFIFIFQVINVYSASIINDSKIKENLSTIFKSIGYSPVCVASSLASCESSSKAEHQIHLAELIPELKTLIRDTKCDRKVNNINSSAVDKNANVTQSVDEIKFLLYEVHAGLVNAMRSVQEVSCDTNTARSIDELTAVLTELKLEAKFKRNFVIDECLKNLIAYNKEIQDLKMANAQVDVCYKVTEKVKIPKNCADIRLLGDTASGARIIYPSGEFKSKPVAVYCDQTTDGGGWTVIQNRVVLTTREDFFRNWKEYQKGFGNIYGEFWVGLENIRDLVKSIPMELRVELEDYEGSTRFAKYGTFNIGDSDSEYTLNVGEYSGDAGDSLAKRHNGYKFSTYDNDNDISKENCAIERHGGWWYTDCDDSNLNGFPHVREESSNYHGIQWDTFHSRYYSLKTASMKIRPVSSA